MTGHLSQHADTISKELLRLFIEFWDHEHLDTKSKTTRYRYAAALQSLGGHLVDLGEQDEDSYISVSQLVVDNIIGGEGPLIHHEDEQWQRELDTVCRKLLRFIDDSRQRPEEN